MLKKLKTFSTDECGAITVDWVVLTGGIVILGFLVLNIVSPAAATQSTMIAAVIVN